MGTPKEALRSNKDAQPAERIILQRSGTKFEDSYQSIYAVNLHRNGDWRRIASIWGRVGVDEPEKVGGEVGRFVGIATRNSTANTDVFLHVDAVISIPLHEFLDDEPDKVLMRIHRNALRPPIRVKLERIQS